jgi:hypothetical protein
MQKRMTLTRRVLNYMLDFDSITSWEAIKEFGATRLSSIIFNLRKKGFIIESEKKTSTNRYGDPVRYVEYKLDKKKTFKLDEKVSSGIND